MTDPAAESKEPEIIEATVVRDAARPRRNRIIWLLLFIALALFAAAGGIYYKLIQELRAHAQESQNEIAALRLQFDNINERMASLATEVKSPEQWKQEMERRLGEFADKQAAFTQEVTQSLAQLGRTHATTDKQWLLSEVQYLLTVAEQRLRLERDVQTATAAVENADRRLSESNDPSLIPLRERIISDLNALRAVRPVDISGLALTLADMIDRVESLPLKGGEPVETTEPPAGASTSTESPASADDQSWGGALRSMWKNLISLVDVKSMAVPDDVIFDPGKRHLLQQNLRLEFAAARLEVLRHDTQNFHATLMRITEVLQRYYDTQAPAVASALETLARMREAELAPVLPTLEQSLALIRAQTSAVATPDISPP